jgi:membrane protein required for colicin V production
VENINYFDLIILALVTLLGLKGLFRGFIKEAFALFGIVGGVFVASRVSSQVGEIVDNIIHFDNNNTVVLVGFIVSLAVFWVVAYILGTILSKMIGLSGLGFLDRFLGFVFGAGKVFLLFSIIVYALSNVESINKKLEEKVQDSMVYPILKQTGQYIIKLDTTNIQEKVSKNIDKAIEAGTDTLKDISAQEIKKKAQDTVKTIKKEIKE